ncbi:MAG: hypothetical protein WAW52_07725 [Methanothrix sp.]
MEGVEGISAQNGILYSIYLSDGEVLGKVRLNKLMARLQREGFPITNRFINERMGPYDAMIDGYASELCGDHLISQSLSPRPQHYNDREDFRLTAEGIAFVEQNILPAIKDHPYYNHLIYSFSNIKHEYKHLSIKNLVDNVHDELCLSDNKSVFLLELDNTKKKMMAEFDKLEAGFIDYCYASMVLLGSLEFAIRAITKIQEGKWDNNETGKNNILYNSQKLLESVSSSQTIINSIQPACMVQRACLNGMDCVAEELNKIKYGLYRIEWNSEIYQILRPFDRDYDLNDYQTEVEESALASRLQEMRTMV